MEDYTVFAVANWFLNKQAVSPKKLQKLTYYAQAWANALYNKNMINDSKFEAWAHGPVSPALYEKYRGWGWQDITKNEENTIDDSETIDLLESVWLTYGDKSANELEALTHQEMPWRNARGDLADGESSNQEISEEDMKNYYKSIYAGD
ncbi:DUF4065 domain-containing protein [Latilactobacillus curvatus]|uniref:Panacea domain-containing protein n=1 Tax=Latilactobacillus curvatus TaxID=28038 RepID=UPI002072CCA9|nr:type II toxin-antitoxin system antitoxin SocA domain-containing protein [Latilactobacillus curvatus]MCM6843529.1 DUF4065 domain-containing protein [Latilactobacillus curvatus]MCM6861591.1 DUF4065 domain-containing protein [Latilactobacillus curvatus]MCM6868890.1 DUF4065 domain-containing protein [Latilactobacillus curvatus]